MVVTAATDVAVLNRRLVRHGLWAVGPVEIVTQDRRNRTVATGANIDATLTSGLDAFATPGTHQPQDAETSPEALPLCQTSCRLNRNRNPGGAGRRTWLDTDKRTRIG